MAQLGWLAFYFGLCLLLDHVLSKRISESEAKLRKEIEELRKEIENVEKKVDEILEE